MTVQGPVKEQQPVGMSHRGVDGVLRGGGSEGAGGGGGLLPQPSERN